MKVRGTKAKSTMKIRYLITMFLMICISSCVAEEIAIEHAPGSRVIYAGWEESGDETKTSLESGRRVVWNKGDKIAYLDINVNKSQDSDYYIGLTCILEDQYDGNSVGVFKGLDPLPVDDYFNFCVYPDDDNYLAHVENGRVMLYNKVAKHRTLQDGSFEKKANISVGKEESTKGFFLFRNVFGLLSISLTGTAIIKQISLKSDSEEPLWGDIVIDMSYGEEGPAMTFINTEEEDHSVIILESDEGVQLSEDRPSSFYFTLPPGSLQKGFSITILSNEGKSMTLHGTLPKGETIKRSVITPMPIIAFSGKDATPDENADYITVIHSNEIFSAPVLTGINQGWKVFWGDGIGSLYFPGLSHSYTKKGTYSVSVQINGATQVEFGRIEGIESIDFSRF